MLIDFDNSSEWFKLFDDAFGQLARDIDWSDHSDIEFIDEAFDILSDWAAESTLANTFQRAFAHSQVTAYHGTRLTDDEVASVSVHGLKPLKVADRAHRYDLMFADHPDWATVRVGVVDALDELGPKAILGNREDGRVWACYSRAGLLDCDYLVHGAEIDHHVASKLFNGESAHEYLRNYGLPRIVSFWCTMAEAEQAVTPFATILPDELSWFAKRLLGHWAYSKISPFHSCATERDCTQMGLNFPITRARIVRIETLA